MENDKKSINERRKGEKEYEKKKNLRKEKTRKGEIMRKSY